jgi:hypothetical protein
VIFSPEAFTVTTDVKVYFCDPRSPWQRGSNEDTNGLLRQYFPKGKDLSIYSQAYLNEIALRLNQRPRETLALNAQPIDYVQCCSDRLSPPSEAAIGAQRLLCVGRLSVAQTESFPEPSKAVQGSPSRHTNQG